MTTQSKLFPIKTPDKMRRIPYVFISHMANFSLKFNPIAPYLKNYAVGYNLDKVESYFLENLEKRQLPYHFYVCFIKGDWKIFTGAPINYRSPLLTELSSAEYIQPAYTESIVVAVQDNFSLRIPDQRLHDIIASKIVIPYRQLLKNKDYLDSVVWFDEVFNKQKYDSDMERYTYLKNKYPFQVTEMKFFDRIMFNVACRTYS